MTKKYRLPLLEEMRGACRLVAAVAGLFLMLAGTAMADEIDGVLPPGTPPAVKTAARQAIDSGLQEKATLQLTRAMLQADFDAQQVQRALAVMTAARQRGLPVTPLAGKAFEGIAKNVDPAMILHAMETVNARNDYAHSAAVRFSANREEAARMGNLISSALAAGLSRQDVDELGDMVAEHSRSSETAGAHTLAMACFEASRDVSRLGVESQAVVEMVAAALNRGFGAGDMRAMRSAFLEAARQSNPRDLARSFSSAIHEGRDFHGAASAGHAGGQSQGQSPGGMVTGSPGQGDAGGGVDGGGSPGGGAGSGSGGSGGGDGTGGSGPGGGGPGPGGSR